ncbi:hypothetical protein BH11PSE14_BH11PSE14_15410 [soil metagenome]
MPLSIRDRTLRLFPALLAIGLPLIGLALVGADGNWDLRNYHLYNPHAWLHGREAIDVAPAQLQSWHNPLLDLPYYLLTISGAPPLLGDLWLAAWAMLLLATLLKLQRSLSTESPALLAQAVLAVLALSGAGIWSTFATTMNDVVVAAGVLGALCLLHGRHVAPRDVDWAWAGLAAGIVAGLKLTALFYCGALAVATLCTGLASRRLPRLGWLTLGGVAGFLLSYGFWGWHLWQAHGNPLFPYFNQWFQSPDALSQAYADQRFRPPTVLDAMLAPVALLRRSQHFSELWLRDPRMLLALVCFAWLAWRQRAAAFAETRFAVTRDDPAIVRRREAFAFLAVFTWTAAAVWAVQFGIYRYATALEALGVLALVLMLQQAPRWRTALLLLAFLLVSADTKRPHWGRVAPAPRIALSTLTLPKRAIVLATTDEPMGYLALALPDDVPFVSMYTNMAGLRDCTRLQRKARAMLSDASRPVFLASAPEGHPINAQRRATAALGLVTAGACRPVSSTLGDAKLCPQRRAAPARACGAP